MCAFTDEPVTMRLSRSGQRIVVLNPRVGTFVPDGLTSSWRKAELPRRPKFAARGHSDAAAALALCLSQRGLETRPLLLPTGFLGP